MRFVLHIKPIQPKDAHPAISSVYKDIQSIFDIDTVPLVFQYIANYEYYFLFLWDRMKTNIRASSFQESRRNIESLAAQAIDAIYTPSDAIKEFIKQIHLQEKHQILETVTMLEKINTTLLLLLIDLRESMKSIFIGSQRISQYTSKMHEENFTEFMEKDMGLSIRKFENNEITEASKMLAPLFGSNAIIVSHYPDFFAHTATEMENLKNTEVYLKSRLSLEHLSLQSISHFVQPLGVSYQEFLKLTEGKVYIHELLYLLTDAFPSQFPHLVFTTALMRDVLEKQ